MKAAKAAGAAVSMDLASFELVRNCKASLVDLVESKCLDIVFANESEVGELARVLNLLPAEKGTSPIFPPSNPWITVINDYWFYGPLLITHPWVAIHAATVFLAATHEDLVNAAQSYLLKHTSLSVVSRGPKGCTVRSTSGQTAAAPADDVKVSVCGWSRDSS